MTFLQLEYFCTLTEANTLSDAAKALYLTQSALSKALKDLETDLGCELFFRTAKGLQMNENGKELYRIVHPLVENYHQVSAHMMSFAADAKRKLSVCSHYVDFNNYLGNIMLQKFPDVRLSLKVSNRSGEALAQQVANGTLDCAFAGVYDLAESLQQQYPSLRVVPVFTDRLRLCVDKDNLLYQSEKVKLEDVDFKRIIFTDTTEYLFTWLSQLAKAENIRFHFSNLLTWDIFKNIWPTLALDFFTTEYYVRRPDLAPDYSKQKRLIAVDSPLAETQCCIIYKKDNLYLPQILDQLVQQMTEHMSVEEKEFQI